jgi:glucan biosynthesis protein C
MADTAIETKHVRHETAERLHYLDNLRAIAMLLGVFLHAGLAYAEPAREVWLATDSHGSVVIDAAIWLIHLFRMSLFFLLSGYFGKLLWSRRGVGAYFKGRLLRIALPFVLFYPFLWAAMMVVFVFALSYLKEPQGIMGLIAASIRSGEKGGEQQQFTAMHLWFLYYLMMFVLLSIPLARFRFGWLNSSVGKWYGMVGVALVLSGAVYWTDVPLPAPESFAPALWPFLFYGSFYWLGWQLFGKEELFLGCEKYAWLILGGCLLLYVPYYLLLPKLDVAMVLKKGIVLPLGQKLMLSLLTGALSLGLTLCSIALGKKYFNGNRPSMRFLADASYWIYLVHLPLVMGLQTLLILWEISIYLKLGIVILVTMFFSLLSYVVLVRYTPIGWMLHGKRKFP